MSKAARKARRAAARFAEAERRRAEREDGTELLEQRRRRWLAVSQFIRRQQLLKLASHGPPM